MKVVLVTAVALDNEKRFREFLRIDTLKLDLILAATSHPQFKLKWTTV